VASNFPTSLDNFTNPSSGNTLDSPSHSLQHSDINDAVEALEAKLGIGASPAGSATSGQVLTASTGGTTTWSTPTTGGLIQIVPSSVAVGSGSGSANANGAVTFTGASSVSLNDVFSATYDNYKIILKITSAAAGNPDITMRLRIGGADNSTSNYAYQAIVGTYGASAIAGGSTGNSSFPIGGVSTVFNMSVDLISPFLTESTIVLGSTLSQGAAGAFNGSFRATTSFDSFSFIASSSNITGTISVYGYRD
jgi:hypothetical protein